MKLSSRLLLLAGTVATAVAGHAAFAGTATADLSVTADIDSNCTISASPLSFGTYDPVVSNHSSALHSGSGSVTVTCTSGATPVITLGQGTNAGSGSTDDAPERQLATGSGGSGNLLAYTLYQDSGYATAWGNTADTGLSATGDGTSHTYTVYGSIAGGQNAAVGSYSDTVVATVTY